MQSQIPAWLRSAMDQELHGVSGKALAAEYSKLSGAYRQGQASPKGGGADSGLFWLSYMVGRMPATYAAVRAVLAEVPGSLLESCGSLLDLGCGPGTAVWAAMESLPSLLSATALDRSVPALALAERLAKSARFNPVFLESELPQGMASLPEADLVMLAYCAGESGLSSMQAAFNKAKKLLVVVEPGTPLGFQVILRARAELPNLVAPCPQAGSCPLASAPESKWCHFSTRLERSRMAALLKGGELGYEDEKFSYAVFSKEPSARVESRIIGYPKKIEGQVTLDLCVAEGLKSLKLGRNSKALYKKAKKARWGEAWP